MTGMPEPAGASPRRLIDVRLAVIGLLGGGLSGLLGVGGGVIMVPLLVLWHGVAQRDAHAMSLGAIIVISLGGLVPYAAAGEVSVPLAAALAGGAVVGARVGAGILVGLDEAKLKLVFGVFLVLIAVFTVVQG
jgi:uncharacterized membrane protein YfcA